ATARTTTNAHRNAAVRSPIAPAIAISTIAAATPTTASRTSMLSSDGVASPTPAPSTIASSNVMTPTGVTPTSASPPPGSATPSGTTRVRGPRRAIANATATAAAVDAIVVIDTPVYTGAPSTPTACPHANGRSAADDRGGRAGTDIERRR